MRLIARYRQLSTPERKLFFRALLLAAVVRISLCLLPFRLTWRWVGQIRKPVCGERELDRRTISQVTWSVEAAARRIPGATCLTQGITTQILLGRMGQPTDLRLGVARKPDGAFEAHAWVELNGRIIKGGAVEGFSRFVPLKVSRNGEMLTDPK